MCPSERISKDIKLNKGINANNQNNNIIKYFVENK